MNTPYDIHVDLDLEAIAEFNRGTHLAVVANRHRDKREAELDHLFVARWLP